MTEIEILQKLDEIQNLVTQLRRSILGNSEIKVSLADIIKAVSGSFDIPVNTLKQKTRRSEAVHARACFAYIAWRRGYTLEDIGYAIRRHHSSVIHLVQGYENRLEQYPEYQEAAENIIKKFLHET